MSKKKKKSSKTGLDHDKGWQTQKEALLCRGITVTLLLWESFVSQVRTCQGSYTHKEFWMSQGEIFLYFRLNHNSGSNISTSNKCICFWHSSKKFELSCSDIHPSPQIIIKPKNWNVKTKMYCNAFRSLDTQGFLTERTPLLTKEAAIIIVNVLKHTHQE